MNVLGREIEAAVANLRRIDWTTMGINFTLVYAPGLLEAAPHTHIATVYAEPEAESPLLSEVAATFPNVSAIGVRDVLDDVLGILGRIDAAIGGIAALALIAGVVVLAESVAAAQRRRLHERVVCGAPLYAGTVADLGDASCEEWWRGAQRGLLPRPLHALRLPRQHCYIGASR